nr:VOC family protein [Pseudovibrio flavus]
MSHVSVGTDNFEKAVEFYKRVLATIGAKVVMEHPGAVAFGKQFPEFWVQTPIDGQPAGVGNGTHFGFIAPSNDAVHAFWEVALEMGAVPEGEPGPRPHYGEPYYGCFVRDLDGHKIEAAAWNAPL